MTVSVKDKIELFRSIIFRDIEESASKKKERAAKSFEQEKSRIAHEAEAEKISAEKKAEKKAEKGKQQLAAKAKMRSYRDILANRQRYIDQIMGLLVERAEKFVFEEGYKEYLLENLRKTSDIFENAESVELSFSRRDLEDLGEFIGQYVTSQKTGEKYRTKEAVNNVIGGFYAEDSKGGVLIDCTLRSLIEENREMIGSSISRRLNEVYGNGC